jgi:hypothetical protein
MVHTAGNIKRDRRTLTFLNRPSTRRSRLPFVWAPLPRSAALSCSAAWCFVNDSLWLANTDLSEGGREPGRRVTCPGHWQNFRPSCSPVFSLWLLASPMPSCLAFQIARSTYDVALLVVLSGIPDALPSFGPSDPVHFGTHPFMTRRRVSLRLASPTPLYCWTSFPGVPDALPSTWPSPMPHISDSLILPGAFNALLPLGPSDAVYFGPPFP